VAELRAPKTDDDDQAASIGPMGGESDDIGDISWNVPTIVLRYPANISGTPDTIGRTPLRWPRRSRIKV